MDKLYRLCSDLCVFCELSCPFDVLGRIVQCITLWAGNNHSESYHGCWEKLLCSTLYRAAEYLLRRSLQLLSTTEAHARHQRTPAYWHSSHGCDAGIRMVPVDGSPDRAAKGGTDRSHTASSYRLSNDSVFEGIELTLGSGSHHRAASMQQQECPLQVSEPHWHD